MSNTEFSEHIQDRLSVNMGTANSIAAAALVSRKTLMNELAVRNIDEDHESLADELEEARDEYAGSEDFDRRVSMIDSRNHGNIITRHPFISTAAAAAALYFGAPYAFRALGNLEGLNTTAGLDWFRRFAESLRSLSPMFGTGGNLGDALNPNVLQGTI